MKLFLRLLLVLVVLGLLAAGFAYWVLFAPNSNPFEGQRGVKLPAGTGFEAAMDSLEAAGLLSSRTSFRLAGTLTTWGRQLKPGHYRFDAGANNWTLLRKIRSGRQDPIRVTVPPGVRPQVFAAVIQKQLDTPADSLLEALRDTALAAELGTDTAHLFGTMRPNTYDIYWTTSARGVVARLHEEWERWWTDARKARADTLGLSPDEVTTLASIVEWEARQPAERPRIAGVYLNRLFGRGGPRMRLQADPTVQYAIMQREGGRMRRLLYADYATESPYNTYRVDGLPPGPLNNPSESSMAAELDAEDHGYFYFVADGTGTHTFSRTLAEHNRAAARYRTLKREERRRLAREAEAAPQDS